MDDAEVLEEFQKYALKNPNEIDQAEFIQYSRSIYCRIKMDNRAKIIFKSIVDPNKLTIDKEQFYKARKEFLEACKKENNLSDSDKEEK